MKKYDKLIRDRIPEIIAESGKEYKLEVVDDEIALEYLYKKLNEEVDELVVDKNLEEIVDVMEVLFAIADKYGYSENDVLAKRDEKNASNGGFKQNLILKEVY